MRNATRASEPPRPRFSTPPVSRSRQSPCKDQPSASPTTDSKASPPTSQQPPHRSLPCSSPARPDAEAAGVDDRVRFELCDVSAGLPEAYDLVTTFDVVHDAADPA